MIEAVRGVDQGFRIEVQPRGARIVLPRRRLGVMRLAGFVPLVFGCFFSGFAVFWMIGASQSMWNSHGQFQWFGLLFTLWGVPFVLAGFVPIALGVAAMFGRSVVETRDGTLLAGERLGLFTWWRARPLGELKRFTVEAARSKSGRDAGWTTHDRFAAIKAEFTDARPLLMCMGYPRPLLRDLAERLRKTMLDRAPAGLFNEDEQRIEIAEVAAGEETKGREPMPCRDVPQPATSKVHTERTEDGLSLHIPPAGIWRGSKGMFFFSLLWCGFMVMFSGLSVVTPLVKGQTSGVLPFALFSLAFWAIGIGMMLGAINMGRRYAVIDIVDDTLLITRKNLFGVKQHQIQRDQLKEILVGPSGMEVNDVPVLNLQFVRTGGERLKLFTGRDEDELEWLACVLRDAMWIQESSAADALNPDPIRA